MLLNTQDKKTLHNVMRDYRDGLFCSATAVPGAGVAAPGCVLCKTRSDSLSYEPGDVIELDGAQTIDRIGLSDEEYKIEQLCGCTDRALVITSNASRQWETDSDFRIIRFGIAKEYISSSVWGNVQVSGYVWAPIEIPDSSELATQTHVIARSNSRHEKTFLQTAADGTAEVVTTGKTMADGFTYALLRLGCEYKKSLYRAYVEEGYPSDSFHIFTVSNDVDPSDLSFRVPGIYRDGTHGSSAVSKHVIAVDTYFPSYDNLIRVKPISEGIFDADFFRINESNSHAVIPLTLSQSTDSEYLPDYYRPKNEKTPAPFRGGVYSAVVKKDVERYYVKLFGVKFYLSTDFCALRRVDVWENDKIIVRLDVRTPQHVEILAAPQDYPIGTIQATYGTAGADSGAYPYARGWRPFSLPADVDIFTVHGGASLSSAGHTHTLTVAGTEYTTGTGSASASAAGELTFYRKEAAGWPG